MQETGKSWDMRLPLISGASSSVVETMLPEVLWDWAKTTGPAGFALIVWWLERRERMELQKRNDALVDRIEKVALNATTATNRLTEILTGGRSPPPSVSP